MACNRCEMKGYIESHTIRDGGVKTLIQQCPTCRDVVAYSRRIQHGEEYAEMVQRVKKNRKKFSGLQLIPGGKDG